MKNIYLLIAVLLLNFTTKAQVFWTETFSNACTANCAADLYIGPNGDWKQTITGTEGTDPNRWYVSCAENNQGAGNCGAGCGTSQNPTLHVGSSPNSLGDLGATYDAGGLCGILTCPQTNRRIESPLINCSGKSNITLSFIYIETGEAPNDDASVWYSDGNTWAMLTNTTPTNNAGCNGQGRWTSFNTLLPASANNNPNVKIGFLWTNNDDGIGTDPSFAVDDIILSTPGSTTSINPPTITDTTLCACQSTIVNFSSVGTFTQGNEYNVLMSDENGSFTHATNVGFTASAANSGQISILIPCSAAGGSGYRFRIISENPQDTSAATSETFTISPEIKLDAVPVNSTCYDSCDGSILVDVVGGLPPYSY